jgi:antitoxin HicB
MRYPANIEPDGRFFLVMFPDIPEAITQGESRQEALQAAESALTTAIEFYFDDSRPVPAPSEPKPGQAAIDLPASLSAKILLLNEMIHQHIRPAELARRLHSTPQQMNRLTSIRHTSRIDGIAAALKTLGKNLEVTAR